MTFSVRHLDVKADALGHFLSESKFLVKYFTLCVACSREKYFVKSNYIVNEKSISRNFVAIAKFVFHCAQPPSNQNKRKNDAKLPPLSVYLRKRVGFRQ